MSTTTTSRFVDTDHPRDAQGNFLESGNRTCASRKTIEWAGAKGQALVATIKVTRGLQPRAINADGQMIYTGTVDVIDRTSILIHMDGEQVASDSSISPAYPGLPSHVAGIIGGKVAIRADQVTAINAAIKEATAEVTTPEFAAHVEAAKAAQDKADKESAEYDAHYRRVSGMMTLNGRSY
jgi:hypothetical protein